MRLIRVTDVDGNVYQLDIDDSTSIGIDFQAYDFKEPGKRKINISNSFTVPATSHNMRAFGFPGNVHTRSNRFYEKWYIDYWIDNIHFVKNARMRLEQIDLEANRITLFIFEKADIWEDMRNLLWPDMIPELLLWLRDEKGYPVRVGGSSTHEFSGSLEQFLNQYVGNTEGLTLLRYFGNLAQFKKTGEAYYSEGDGTIDALFGKIALYRYDVNPDDATDEYFAEGGHFSIFARTMFEFLEYKYGYNFYTAGGGFAGNIWDDYIISMITTPIRDICVSTIDGTAWDFFQRNDSYPGYFYPHKDTGDKTDKSVFDFVQAFFHHFNIVIDSEDNSTDVKLRRFDDITLQGRVYDWSGLAKRPLFKPYVTGYAQNNYIKFASVYPGGNEYLNSKTIVCGNTSLDTEADLFTIDAYIPSLTAPALGFMRLDSTESFETFTFMLAGPPTTFAQSIRCSNRLNTDEYFCSIPLGACWLVSLASEYATVSAALTHPEYYEIEKWLSLSDMVNFGPFNLYYFRELNGTYFINKISGFNPDKSKAPTKMEVIKITDKAPEAVFNTNFWTDGIGDTWTDGSGDSWI